MTSIVLDASAGVELALQTATGRRLQTRLPAGATTFVPEHYFSECAAVLRRLEGGGKVDAGRADLALTRLLSAPNRRLAVKPLIRAAWRLRHNLTVGDALYVVVAEHLGAPLVTTDLRLARAPTLGISTITP